MVQQCLLLQVCYLAQGSVIGPLLFLVYIHDVCSVELSHNCHITLYADDILLYKPINFGVIKTNLTSR